MVTRASTVLLLALGLLLLPAPAWAGDIVGHVFSDSFPDPADPPPPWTPQGGIFDEGIDTPGGEAVLLTQIGFVGGPPGDEFTNLGQWFAMPDANGFFEFTGLPDGGIFQIDLPFQSDAAGFMANIVMGDMPGMKTAEPVPAPPLGIVPMPPTPTVVDIPLLPASAPCSAFAVPDVSYVVGGIFVDRNPGGQTGGNGFDTSPGGFCTIGNQGPFGAPVDGIEVLLQCLDTAGNPVGAPLATIVGSAYTFTPGGGPGGTEDYQVSGVFMFLGKALADGDTVQVSIDPSQPALAGLLPVSDITVLRTLDLTPPAGEPAFRMIQFRFQPAFDLNGRVKVIDTQGTERGMPGVELTLTDLVTGMVVETTTTDPNGDYQFADLFNSVYLVTVESSGGKPAPSGVRQIENLAPADLDFCFDQTTCPDGVAPTLSLPENIVEECGSTTGNAISWAATATDDFTPDDQILITYAPFQPGAPIPASPDPQVITVTATDWCGNVATGTFTVHVRDTTPPDIDCTLVRSIIWPPRLGLVPIGLAASANDICDGSVDVVVTVFSDEDDGTPPFSPDATGATIPALKLRAERTVPGNGRVYLIRITATDQAGNTAVVCKCSCVPLAPIASSILDVLAQAASAETECMELDPDTGVPEGFEEILRIPEPEVEEQ